MSDYEGLTDEQVRAEEELMSGVPLLNVGALFLPPIWGPGHGQWWTILWYPVWAFCDTAFYLGFVEGSKGNVGPLGIFFAVLLLVCLVAVTVLYARLSQPYALHRALGRGVSKQEYLRRERIWAVVCVAVGVVFLVLATWYNLALKPTLG